MEKLPECKNLLAELASPSVSAASCNNAGGEASGAVKEESVLMTDSVEMEHIKVYLRI